MGRHAKNAPTSELTSVGSSETPLPGQSSRSNERVTHPRSRPKPRPVKVASKTFYPNRTTSARKARHLAMRAESIRTRYRPLLSSPQPSQEAASNSDASSSSDALPTQVTQNAYAPQDIEFPIVHVVYTPKKITSPVSVKSEPHESDMHDTGGLEDLSWLEETEETDAPEDSMDVSTGLRERVCQLESRLVSLSEEVKVKTKLLRKVFKIDKENGTRTGHLALQWLADQLGEGDI